MSAFYDDMASLYHLVYANWDEGIARQAGQLAGIIEERWGLRPGASILDVSCGIGTQAIGLARLGFQLTGSDLSQKAVERARVEAQRRGVHVAFSACDMREAYKHHARRFDVVLSCDNSITHLLTDDDIGEALRQIYQCLVPGGGCLLTVRDYDREQRGVGLVKPYGIREEEGKRYLLVQVWDFDGDVYEVSLYVVMDTRDGRRPQTRVMRAKYYAIRTSRLLELMKRAGFGSVARLDGRFFQPVFVGTREA